MRCTAPMNAPRPPPTIPYRIFLLITLCAECFANFVCVEIRADSIFRHICESTESAAMRNIAPPIRKSLMQIHILKSKIHRATVTGASLNYEGSLTVDRDLMDKVGLVPYERVLCSN